MKSLVVGFGLMLTCAGVANAGFFGPFEEKIELGRGVVVAKSAEGILQIEVSGGHKYYYDVREGLLLADRSGDQKFFMVEAGQYPLLDSLGNKFIIWAEYVKTGSCSMEKDLDARDKKSVSANPKSIFKAPVSASQDCRELQSFAVEAMTSGAAFGSQNVAFEHYSERGKAINIIIGGRIEKSSSAGKVNDRLVGLREQKVKNAVAAAMRDVPPDKELVPRMYLRGNERSDATAKSASKFFWKAETVRWLGAQVMLDDDLAKQLRGLDYPLVNPAVWTEKAPYLDQIVEGSSAPLGVMRFASRRCGKGQIEDDMGNKYCAPPGVSPEGANLKKLYTNWVRFLAGASPDDVRRLVVLAGIEHEVTPQSFDGLDDLAGKMPTAGMFAAKALNPVWGENFNPLLRKGFKSRMPGIGVEQWLQIYYGNNSTGAEQLFAALLAGDQAAAQQALVKAVPDSILNSAKSKATAYAKNNPQNTKDWEWVSLGFGGSHYPPLYIHLQKLAGEKK